MLRDHTTLVTGALPPSVEGIARETAAARHGRLVAAGERVAPARPRPSGRRTCAATWPWRSPPPRRRSGELDPAAIDDAVVALELHGRMETVGSDPPLILDAAHNPDGARALAEAIAATAGGRPAFAALAVLADKDVEGIVAALAPACAGIVATEIPAQRLAHAGRPGARPMPAARIAAAARAAGIDPVLEAADPARGAGPRPRARASPAAGSRCSPALTTCSATRAPEPALGSGRERPAVAVLQHPVPVPSTVSPCWTGRRDRSCST